MTKYKLVSLFLLVALLVTAIVPSGNVLASDDVVKGASPVLVSPKGLILDRTPTFKWNKVTGATKYKLEVIQYSTKVIVKEFASSTCGTYCTFTPSTNLFYLPYKWHVQALVSGVWKPFSNFMEFTISSPSFTSYFNGNLNGWDKFKNRGADWFAGPTFAYTNGKAGYWSLLYRYANGAKYNDFQYTATIKRTGGTSGTLSPANCLMVRMGAYTTSGTYLWWPGYRFCINNAGKYEIWYMDPSTETYSIQKWTTSAAILTGANWNKLSVLAVGSAFEFYINDVLVDSFTDVSKDRGYVGLAMYKYSGTTTQFQVDSAKVLVQGLAASSIRTVGEPATLVPVSITSLMGSD